MAVRSRSQLSPSCSSPLVGKDLLNFTIFGMNRLSISNRPRNALGCLEADRSGHGQFAALHRQLYLSDGLAVANKMYTADIAGHHSCVNAIAFSNLGEEHLVSGGDDQRVLVWKVADLIHADSHTPKQLTMAARHQSNVFSAAFSCDNRYIYSGGDDHELIKHDFTTGQPISHHEHLDAVYSVAPHPTLPSVVITASEDGCVYTVDTREPYRRVDSEMILCEEMTAYHCAAVNPVEPRLVAVCNGYTGTSLYDTRQKKKLLWYKLTQWPIGRQDAVSASFSSNGCQLYVMHRTLPPCLFDLWNEKVKLSFVDNTGSYKNMVTMKSGCFMGQNDEYVVSGSDDFRVYVWKIPNKEEEEVEDYLDIDSCMSTMPHLVLPGHRSIVNQTCYSKSHHILATSGVEKIIKIWSHERLNSSHQISISRAPPSRTRYSQSEVLSLIHDSPVDPLSEDPSVLAFFDSLLEEGELDSHLYDSSSSDDEDHSSHGFFDHLFHRHVMIELPFYPHWSLGDSDATPTDSELSFANSSSLEPPWSEDDLDDEHGGGFDDWSSHNDSDNDRSSHTESEGEGRVGRISNHHDHVSQEEEKGSKVVKRKIETEGACASNSGLPATVHEQSKSRSVKSEHKAEPTRSQPSRKVKKTGVASMRSSSSASGRTSDKPLQNGDTRRRQPERKVKSAQGNASDINFEPTTSDPSSSVLADGPSERWTRKMKRREQEEAGTTSNYEQYRAEDFLKPKSPSSFYSKKDPPP